MSYKPVPLSAEYFDGDSMPPIPTQGGQWGGQLWNVWSTGVQTVNPADLYQVPEL